MPKPTILFFSEGTTFKLTNRRKVIHWISHITASEKVSVRSLNYIFCSDALIGKMNKQYLNHSTLTDILTFDHSESAGIEGEIFISIRRVRENAKRFNQSFDTELRRVMAHGLLHLFGYGDKTAAEKAKMRSKEEACLSLWK